MQFLTTAIAKDPSILPIDASKLSRIQTAPQKVKVFIPDGDNPQDLKMPEGFILKDFQPSHATDMGQFYIVTLQIEDTRWSAGKRESRYPMSPSQKGAPIPSYPSNLGWREKAFSKYHVKQV